MIGKTLAHYEILEKIGEGGMGVVYRATDTKLGRDVALKILPAEVAQDRERKSRFEREARFLASLNHPNIVAIHSVETSNGYTFITMELVSGRPLSELTPPDGLPLSRILDIAVPVSNALAAAHEGGVVHRDIKPANIMVGRDDIAKILDFGIARPAQAGVDKDSTISASAYELTAEGRIVGTVAYMSPEQAEGRPVDHRSDIFSFGVVLYEMTTGRRPFRGDTTAALISSILKDVPPPIAATHDTLPRDISRIIRRCLEKRPDRRYQTTRDLCLELEELQSALASGELDALPPHADPAPHHASWRRRGAFAVGYLLAASILFASLRDWIPLRTNTAPEVSSAPRRLFQLSTLGELPTPPEAATISPDGSMIAYFSEGRLWVHTLSQSEPIALVECPTGYDAPFWSPDASQVGFLDSGGIHYISAHGGDVVTVSDATLLTGAAWTDNHEIAYSPVMGQPGIFTVPEHGGDPRCITPTDSSVIYYTGPHVLPGTDSFVCCVERWTSSELVLLEHGAVHTVLSQPPWMLRDVVYDPAGGLLFQSGSDLWTVPLDLESRRLAGPPTVFCRAAMSPSISRDRTLAYVQAPPEAKREELVWLNRRGEVVDQLPLDEHGACDVALAPDGHTVAFSGVHEGNRDLWLFETGGPGPTRLTFHPLPDLQPSWFPSEDALIFRSHRSKNLLLRRIGSTAEPYPIIRADGMQFAPHVSPSGRYCIFSVLHPDTQRDLQYVELPESTNASRDLHSNDFLSTVDNETLARISPDDGLVAYQSDESGAFEILVQTFPAGGRRYRVSREGGFHARWSPLGNELFYVGDDALMSVTVDPGAVPAFGKATPVFRRTDEIPLMASWWNGAYDVGADGESFVAIRTRPISSEDSLSSVPRIVVAQNW